MSTGYSFLRIALRMIVKSLNLCFPKRGNSMQEGLIEIVSTFTLDLEYRSKLPNQTMGMLFFATNGKLCLL